MGMLFIVGTDHSSLRALWTKEELAGRLQRYTKKLLMFDYDIHINLERTTSRQTYYQGLFITSRH